MIKVALVTPVPKPDIVITLDGEAAEVIVKWLGEVDTPHGPVEQLWDALDDVVRLRISESVRGRA